jgi:hypothetical protein
MKESYGEGVATHTGLESCAGARKGMGEALTEACAGRVLSCESFGQFGVPPLLAASVTDGWLDANRRSCRNKPRWENEKWDALRRKKWADARIFC